MGRQARPVYREGGYSQLTSVHTVPAAKTAFSCVAPCLLWESPRRHKRVFLRAFFAVAGTLRPPACRIFRSSRSDCEKTVSSRFEQREQRNPRNLAAGGMCAFVSRGYPLRWESKVLKSSWICCKKQKKRDPVKPGLLIEQRRSLTERYPSEQRTSSTWR